MNTMDFNKALSILGLNRNYTEEDLKKAYRKLITKYHPDKCEGKSKLEKKSAEEKTKEINAAKEFLENYKEQRTHTHINNSNNCYSHAAYNYVVFTQSKESFIRELNNYDAELRNIMYKASPAIIQKTIKTVLELNYLYKDILRHVKNITDLNKKIIEYKAKVWKILEEFTIEYCNKYNIKTDTSKLEKYSLKKLYEELEKIRQEKNIHGTILDKIEEEYSLYAGYTKIKEKIDEIKKQILDEYKSGLYSEEESKRKFETKVLLEFKEYYGRLNIINYFKSLSYKDKVILETITLMEENILADKETFKMYEKSITNYIADKESKRHSKVIFKPYDIKELKQFNTSDKATKKD